MKQLLMAASALVLMATASPAQAWTCLPVKYLSNSIPKKAAPEFWASIDIDYSPETGWTITVHGPDGQIGNWQDHIAIENIDGSQWRGVPTARLLPKFEGWSATGKLYLGEDGVMNYTEQTWDSSGKLDHQWNFKCHKELVS